MSQLSEQQDVWMALSDLFVDNEISYEYIAQRVAHLTLKQVKDILFYEVAPVCMSNLLVLKPTNYKGFSEDFVIPAIRQHLQKRDSDKFYNYKTQIKVKCYKFFLRQEWIKVATAIYQIQMKAEEIS